MDKRTVKSALSRHFVNSSYDITAIIYLYRYLSWAITSMFYIIGMPRSPLIYKLTVAASLLVAGKLTTDVYIKNKQTDSTLKCFVIVETIGISLLLLTTGGISSPFIWYALNPVLVAANFLSLYFCWLNLVFYISCALFTSYVIFNQKNFTLVQMASSNSNIILVLILITLVVGMLSSFSRKLKQKAIELEGQSQELARLNSMLKVSNTRLEEYVQDMMALYQVVEAFSNQGSLENFLTAFTEQTAKLCKSNFAFFWSAASSDSNSIIATNSNEFITSHFIKEMEHIGESAGEFIKPQRLVVNGVPCLAIQVKSSTKLLGLIGIEMNDVLGIENEDNIQKLSFLSELSAVILERFQFENIANSIMVAEEQTRIANEVHDSVSQRIFGISCSLHSIKNKWRNLSAEQIESELNYLSDAAKNALKDLRCVIYDLSYKKRGEKYFENNLRSFIHDMERLNSVSIDFSTEGDIEGISPQLKHVIHRIIHEACGNAIRHGTCSELVVKLSEAKHLLRLSIIDDGRGFDTNKTNNLNYGLGIYNMKRMIETFKGTFTLRSKQGEGTEINITVPDIQFYQEVGGFRHESRNSG